MSRFSFFSLPIPSASLPRSRRHRYSDATLDTSEGTRAQRPPPLYSPPHLPYVPNCAAARHPHTGLFYYLPAAAVVLRRRSSRSRARDSRFSCPSEFAERKRERERERERDDGNLENRPQGAKGCAHGGLKVIYRRRTEPRATLCRCTFFFVCARAKVLKHWVRSV